jgi:uncharacterized membrane protein
MNGGTQGTIVSITAGDGTAAEEGPDTGTFTITRSGAVSAALVVDLSIAGTATVTTDYTTSPDIIAGNTVTIPVDSASIDVVITPVADVDYVEGEETVIVTIVDGGDYVAGTQDTATITISDYDPGKPGVFDLTFPTDLSANAGLTPTLVWTSSSGATSYSVEVYSDDTKSTLVDSSTVDAPATTYAVAATLTTDTQYWWYVTATNGSQTTDARNNGISFFTTPDAPPTVLGSSPAKGATDVALDAVIRITFSEPMNPTTLTAVDPLTPAIGSVKLVGPTGALLGCTVELVAEDTVLTVTPDATFNYETDYVVRIMDTATDVSGKQLDGDGTGGAGGNFELAFTTFKDLVGYAGGEGCVPGAGGVAWMVLLLGALVGCRRRA